MRASNTESMKMQIPCSSCKKQCVSELLGTYALVFLGPGSVVIASLIPNFTGFWATVFIGSVFGGTVGTMIFFLGKHSGAIINPAVTFGVAVARILHSRYFLPYLFFQVVGGLLAGLSLKILFSSVGATNVRLGSTMLSPGINPIQGFTLEVVGTFVLTTAALLASTQLHKAWQQGLLVGLTLFSLIQLIGPLTGAGFNPARSLGPAFAAGFFENLPIYVIGPILGASMAGLVFRIVRENARKSSSLVCLC